MDGTIKDIHIELIEPKLFDFKKHYYPQVLETDLAPDVEQLLNMTNEQIAIEYCRLNSNVNQQKLLNLLQTPPKLFHWSGTDLFLVLDHQQQKQKQMLLIETNSCPSGQKSMPNNRYGYHHLMKFMFCPLLKGIYGDKSHGRLAVIYDKNLMETRGYAEALADVTNECVYFVEFLNNDNVRFIDKQMFVHYKQDWHPIRAAFRYVTQAPWNRIPIHSPKTLIINPSIVCLAGGRNKQLANTAYHIFNHKYSQYGLFIRIPETINNLTKEQIPECIKRLGGYGVIKVPYLNAGQGVYTIVNKRELEDFMSTSTEKYDHYVVQSLVGSDKWNDNKCPYTHVGTIPNENNEVYAYDLRIQIYADEHSFRPKALYGRRARQPLGMTDDCEDSWSMLGTNLSVISDQNPIEWKIESDRLLIMNARNLRERMGITIYNLIDGFVQSVMATHAIDNMAQQLLLEDGQFNIDLFKKLNSDSSILYDILP